MTQDNLKRAKQTGGEYYPEAAGILKAELARRNVGYVDLAAMLGDETAQQLRTKINRGSFSFGFFIRVMRVLGADEVHVGPVSRPRNRSIGSTPRADPSSRDIESVIAGLVELVQRMVEESGRSEGFDPHAWVDAWVRQPHPALAGDRPIDRLHTAEGVEQVRGLLAQQQSGAYA